MFSPELIDSARILRAAINASSSGDNTIVAAQSGKQIRVTSYSLLCASAVNGTWKSGASTSLSGAMPFGANGGIAQPEILTGCLETAVGDALVLNLSGAVQVSGYINYQIIG